MNGQKLIKTANNLDTMSKVCGGIMEAAGIVCAIFAVLVLIFGEKMYDTGSISLDLGFVKLYLAEEYQTAPRPLQVYTIIGLLSVGAVCFGIHYGVKLLRTILAPMKEGRPFTAEVPKNLRKIAWVVLIGGALIQIMGMIEGSVLILAYPMEEIFSSAAISRVEFAFTMDLNFVLVFCILMLLSYVFAYGQQLQQESDETL